MSVHLTKYKWLLLLLLGLEASNVVAQSGSRLDTLHMSVEAAKDDSSKYIAYSKLYTYYEESNRDSALYYSHLEEKLAREHKIQIAVAVCLTQTAYQLMSIGKFADCYTHLLEAFQILDNSNNEKRMWTTNWAGSIEKQRILTSSFANHVYGLLMHRTNHPAEAVEYARKGIQLGEQIDNKFRMVTGNMNLGLRYLEQNKLDSALYYENKAYQISMSAHLPRYQSFIQSALGDV